MLSALTNLFASMELEESSLLKLGRAPLEKVSSIMDGLREGLNALAALSDIHNSLSSTLEFQKNLFTFCLLIFSAMMALRKEKISLPVKEKQHTIVE